MIQSDAGLQEVGYDGMIMRIMFPELRGTRNSAQAFTYAFGYIQALIQACEQ